ncbi:MAG: MFS transporter [Lachnospiraceae bacterium]|nr:MFS transporter [Lachnospiraceae bacterium]
MANNKTDYRALLSQTAYKKLLISTTVNRFGDSLDAVAFAWLIYKITQNGAWSAVIFGLNILPNVIVQPFAGAVVERLNKKNVIVFTHILRAILLTAFLTMFVSGHVNGWIMAAFTLAVSTIESFNMPASTSFIPRVVKDEDLTKAMSLNSMVSGAVTMLGTGLSGIIIAKVSLYLVMIIDIITFLISAFEVFSIKSLERQDKNVCVSQESYLVSLKEGIRYLRNEPVMMNYILVAVILNIILVPINALQAPIVSECFKMDSSLLSVIGVAGSAGAIFGASLIPVISRKLSAKKIVIYFCTILGSGIIAISLASRIFETDVLKYLSAALCFLLMTCCATLISGVANIKFISIVDKRFIARSSAAFVAISTAAIPLTSMIVGFLKAYFETDEIIMMCGILMMIFVLIFIILKPALDIKKGNIYEAETA